MAKNSADAYGASGKTNLLLFDPEDLHLVTDEASPLFDPRVHMPVDENLVRNIMHQGVIQPIVITKNTETGQTEVVAGRQRVKAAREANKRLTAKGCEAIQVPTTVRRSKGADLTGIMVSENEGRTDDTPLGRAEKMRRLMDMGKTEDDLSVLFCCTVATVRNTLALLDCCASVHTAVDAGKINVTQARALAKLEPEEQRARVKELVAISDTTKGHAKAKQQRAIVKPQTKIMKTRKEIIAERDQSSGARWCALDWVLGN